MGRTAFSAPINNFRISAYITDIIRLSSEQYRKSWSTASSPVGPVFSCRKTQAMSIRAIAATGPRHLNLAATRESNVQQFRTGYVHVRRLVTDNWASAFHARGVWLCHGGARSRGRPLVRLQTANRCGRDVHLTRWSNTDRAVAVSRSQGPGFAQSRVCRPAQGDGQQLHLVGPALARQPLCPDQPFVRRPGGQAAALYRGLVVRL